MQRQSRLLIYFIYTAGALLIIAAIAKFVSAAGSARILGNLDPILTLPFRDMFQVAGAAEIVVAAVCFFGKRIALQASLVAWLATSFLIYRIGLIWIGYHKPCPCLGSLTDAIDVSPQVADNVMKAVLTYLLIGSYAILFWLWWQHRKAKGRIQNDEIKSGGGLKLGVGNK